MHISALGVYGDADDEDDEAAVEALEALEAEEAAAAEAAVEAAEVPPEELRPNAGIELPPPPPRPPRPGDLPATAAVVAAALGVDADVVAGGGIMADPRRGEGWCAAGRWTSSHAVPSTLGA